MAQKKGTRPTLSLGTLLDTWYRSTEPSLRTSPQYLEADAKRTTPRAMYSTMATHGLN